MVFCPFSQVEEPYDIGLFSSICAVFHIHIVCKINILCLQYSFPLPLCPYAAHPQRVFQIFRALFILSLVSFGPCQPGSRLATQNNGDPQKRTYWYPGSRTVTELSWIHGCLQKWRGSTKAPRLDGDPRRPNRGSREALPPRRCSRRGAGGGGGGSGGAVE